MHDGATNMFDCRDGISEGMLSTSFPPQMQLGIMAK